MHPDIAATPIIPEEEYYILNRRNKLARIKSAISNYDKASPERQAAMYKYRLLRQYHAHQTTLLHATHDLVPHHLHTSLVTAVRAINNHLKESSHSFVVCPTCYGALTGKSPTKRFKNFTSSNCSCCSAHYRILPIDVLSPNTGIRPSNMRIRSKYTLAEARHEIQTNHPELFI